MYDLMVKIAVKDIDKGNDTTIQAIKQCIRQLEPPNEETELYVGQLCLYPIWADNQSLCLVEITNPYGRLRETNNSVCVKFIKVYKDESGNDYYNYMRQKGFDMRVSKKYLMPIDSFELRGKRA